MTFNRRSLLLASLAASVLSLAVAFIAQYGFGLKPCELCITQRIPYAVVIIIAIGALRFIKLQKYALLLVALLFFVDSGIATYHMSIEKHWIAGPSACTDDSGTRPQSIDDLLKKIETAPVVACDQPQWEFHGITMAMMNAVWALMLGAGVMVAMRLLRLTH